MSKVWAAIYLIALPFTARAELYTCPSGNSFQIQDFPCGTKQPIATSVDDWVPEPSQASAAPDDKTEVRAGEPPADTWAEDCDRDQRRAAAKAREAKELRDFNRRQRARQ